jgi:hypothetical protein
MSEIPPAENLIVLVGNGMNEENQEIIADVLTVQGIASELIHATSDDDHGRKNWPRDGYVHHGGNYYRTADYGKISEGGCVLDGGDYMIVSDCAYKNPSTWRENEFGNRRMDEDIRTVRSVVKQQWERLYGTRVHVVHGNTNKARPLHTLGHIDFFSLLLPHSRKLIVDEYYGRDALLDGSFEASAAAEGLELVPFNGGEYWRGYHPLNALVLPIGGTDVVFYEDRNDRLQRFISDLGAIPIPVPTVGVRNRLSGGIRCVTNTKSKVAPVDSNYLLEREIGYPY